MSAITAAARTHRTAPDTREPQREILTRIARGGLLISATELRYQLARHGHDRPGLLDRLAELQQQGLIESEIHYRLTSQGAALVPTSDRPAPRAISSIPWTSATPRTPQRAPSRSRPRRPRARTSGRRVAPQTDN